MTNSFLEINGAQLWYEEAGQGLPVVFVHAGIADQRMWDDQFPVFAQNYRVIRFDMRGYGRSAMVPGPYAMRDDLYALLKTLGVERAALIGCSRGGSTILDFALEHPEMTAALVPVSAAISGYRDENFEDPPIVKELIAAYQARDLERMNELAVQIWVDGYQPRQRPVDPAVRARVLEMNRIALQTPPDLGQEIPLEPPAFGRAHTIQAPTLVMYGDLDLPPIVDIARHLGTEIPNARLVCMTGTAHLPNMERPQELNQVVLSFLGGIETG